MVSTKNPKCKIQSNWSGIETGGANFHIEVNATTAERFIIGIFPMMPQDRLPVYLD